MEQLESPETAGPGSGTGSGISVRDLRFAYQSDVLADLDLTSGRGEVLSVVGPSGCGKSTLLALIAGFLEPASGAIEVMSASKPGERLAACAHMPQRDTLLPWFSAIDNAAIALRNRGARKSEARRAAAESFERFGLGGFEGARPAELSGGMRQRVAFLRTLLAGKPVLLLDEPFGALDTITRAGMQSWLATALESEPRTVVLITHDIEEALYLGDRMAVLSGRPARVVGELRSPNPRAGDRTAALLENEFVATRREAMAMVEAGA